MGKGEEAVRQQKARAESDPENPKEMDLLIVSYIYADKIEEAYECFLKAVEKFLLSNLLLNCISKPDFVAYNYKYRDKVAFRICRKNKNMKMAAWTVKSQSVLEVLKKEFDIFIFEGFMPKEL